MKLENRTFIVSGGSSGLGLATVKDLLSHSASVSIIDRVAPPPSTLNESRIKFFQADITEVHELEKAVEETVQWSKEAGAPLGGVINCAGLAIAAKMINADGTSHSLEAWNAILAVNVTGTFNLTRIALRHLIRVPPEGPDGERGIIVFVASVAAFEGQPGQTAYAASKGAVVSMTLPLARELGRFGIRVVTVAPGIFASPMSARIPAKAVNAIIKDGVIFPTRFGHPDEFARTVRWAVECGYVNGEVIRLTGAGRLPGRL